MSDSDKLFWGFEGFLALYALGWLALIFFVPWFYRRRR